MRILRFLFNLCWVILVGVWNWIINIITGVLAIVLIIPIFLGIPRIYFRVAPLSLAPAGKNVKLHFFEAPVRNTLWLILGGLIAAVLNYAYGIFLCCTIIFIPLGIQQFKFAKFFFAPFKAEVTKIGEDGKEEVIDTEK